MKKGDEGLPFVPKGKRKAGMGDEGLPLAGAGPAMAPPFAKKRKLAKKKSRGK